MPPWAAGPARGSSLWHCAAREAYEEAGIRGTISPHALARFVTTKIRPNRPPRDIDVVVYPLEVAVELAAWPEQHQRERRWFTPDDARAVVSPELQPVLEAFVAAR